MSTVSISDSGGFEGSNILRSIDTSGGGAIQFRYEMFTIKDAFEIRLDGQSIFKTGFVSGSRSGSFSVNINQGSDLRVIVATNDTNTGWNYDVEYVGRPCENVHNDVVAQLERITRLEVDLGKKLAQADTISLLEGNLNDLRALTTTAYLATAAEALQLAGTFAGLVVGAAGASTAALVLSIGGAFAGLGKSIYESGKLGISDAPSIGALVGNAATVFSSNKYAKAIFYGAETLKALASAGQVNVDGLDLAKWQAELQSINKNIKKLEAQLNDAKAAKASAASLNDDIKRMIDDLQQEYHDANNACFGSGSGALTILASEDSGGVESATASTAIIEVDNPFSGGFSYYGTDSDDLIEVRLRNLPIDLGAITGEEGIRVAGANSAQFLPLGDMDGDGASELALGGFDGAGAFLEIYLSGEGAYDQPGFALGDFSPGDLVGLEGVVRISGAGIITSSAVSLDDFTGDGEQELAFVRFDSGSGHYDVLFESNFATNAPAIDAADGTLDGIVFADFFGAHKVVGNDQYIYEIKNISDLNSNGVSEIALFFAGGATVLYDDQFGALDATDGAVDGVADLQLLTLAHGFTIYAPFSGFQFSASNHLDFADVNGDGFTDIIIGGYARGATESETRIFLGDVGGAASFDAADGSANGVIDLEAGLAPDLRIISNNEFSGLFVSGSSDLTGDGVADLYINDAQNNAAHIIPGSAGMINTLDSASGTQDGEFLLDDIAAIGGYTIQSSTSDFYQGDVSGDFNGDGVNDIIYSLGDEILVLPGGAANLPALDDADGVSDHRIEIDLIDGDEFLRFLNEGFADGNIYDMEAAGDVNGDGVDDFIVSSFENSSGTSSTNVIYGGPTLDVLAQENISNFINGEAGDDTIIGSAATDVFAIGTGNKIIDGGDGDDVAVFAGDFAEFTIATSGEQTTVTNNSSGDITTLTDVEIADFQDQQHVIAGDLLDELPSLAVLNSSVAENDPSGGFVFTLSQPNISPVTIDYRIIPVTGDANDVDTTDQSITFAPGTTSGIIPIGVVDDSSVEAPETFQLQIIGLTGVDRILDPADDDYADLESIVTVFDDDGGAPDLLVEIIEPVDPEINSNATYEFKVTNNGTGGATGVTLSASVSGLEPGTADFDIGDIPIGESRSVFLTGVHQFASEAAAYAEISYNEEIYLQDLGLTNSLVDVSSIAPDPADLAFFLPDVDLVGNQIVLTVDAENIGPGIATGIEVPVTLPNGASVTSFSAIQGTFDDALNIWSVGNMRDGLSRGIELTIDVAEGASGFFSASGSAFEDDPDPSDNTTQLIQLIGGVGAAETLLGGAGVDVIFGFGGGDEISGGDGDDAIHGGSGDDLLVGGAGDDELKGHGDNDTIQGGDGHDELVGGLGNDRVIGGDGNDLVKGAGGDDNVVGGEGNDTVQGHQGNDIAKGIGGDDRVGGLSGDDRILGGAGVDTLIGGADDDLFIYRPGDGADTILDFTPGSGSQDAIALRSSGEDFDTFAEVLAAATDQGSNLLINFGGGDTLLLEGIQKSDLHQDDFVFS